ncbi:DUF1904 family protein [Sedimentibacter sp.]|uniref:DUF1904 family protein n=1 Tax=Sedimentibacter sp. TaxID=1960295 RepID=UPI000EC8427B|nr:DUF1904 family protein [Sedimentibacter sp.]HCX62259.1 DUF1904 domain-containing protein [Clostridiales bacterium]
MPALRLKAIDGKKALTISRQLIDELQELIQCPRDYFSIELVQSKFIMDGKFVGGPQMVDVLWFDRGQDVQDKAAKIITKHISTIGYKNVDVIFHSLEHSKYYENGEHF